MSQQYPECQEEADYYAGIEAEANAQAQAEQEQWEAEQEQLQNKMTKKEKQRTTKQNAALHLLFTQLAEELNSAGLDMRKTLKPDVDIPWSGRTIKEYLWRPIMKAQLGKESTTELTTKEIDQVFDTINRHLGGKFGITISFPSVENLITYEDEK